MATFIGRSSRMNSDPMMTFAFSNLLRRMFGTTCRNAVQSEKCSRNAETSAIDKSKQVRQIETPAPSETLVTQTFSVAWVKNYPVMPPPPPPRRRLGSHSHMQVLYTRTNEKGD